MSISKQDHDLLERNEVKTSSSEHSRQVAHVPVDVLVERNMQEKKALCARKQQIQFRLQELEGLRKEKTSEVLAKRLHKSRQIEMVMAVEADISSQKRPLFNEIRGIDAQLFKLKSQRVDAAALSEEERISKRATNEQKQRAREDALFDVLTRMESLLLRIAESLEAKQ